MYFDWSHVNKPIPIPIPTSFTDSPTPSEPPLPSPPLTQPDGDNSSDSEAEARQTLLLKQPKHEDPYPPIPGDTIVIVYKGFWSKAILLSCNRKPVCNSLYWTSPI